MATKTRKVESGGDIQYFYQKIKEDEYDDKVASIAEEDLVEVIKALEILKRAVESDRNSNASYLENKFVTEDGFQLGYYATKGKVVWYLVLEKYGSGNSVFIKNVSDIENALIGAKNKIDSMKLK